MRISNEGLLAAMMLSLCSGATIAAEAVNPDTLPKIECSSLRYSEDFLQKYPKAPAACLEARVYKGKTYMKVKAKVYVREEPMLSVDLMDPYGNTLGSVLVRKPQSLRVLVNGKEVDVFDLHRDEAVTIWVPQSMFEAK
ncbi:MAG: hypothetical protein QOI59_5196 [Gammaproteobacteria bacterium]|jgi:hypothetical protein|nr:hypothetical protein [Gammaproteobacteria bacterium]